MALQTGDVFGRYELVSWLGRGGMAETWRAQLVGDAGVTKPVLIKKVLPEYANDEAFISMFISEARISATLSHGNVAQVFDFGRVDGEYFLAMEFVDGQPLHRVLKRALKTGMAALPTPVAVFIAMEMCRGLHYAHTRINGSGAPLGIVHRDISPDNVLLGYEGQIKIVDFGIAKAQLLRCFKTAPGVVKGKYLFFSPEQARGEEVDARTDVWATGVVLYELLCGRLPVEGPPHVVMMRVGRGEIPAPVVLRPELPKELNDIVMKALTPDRDQRFESSHAFGDALAGFLYSNFPRFSAMSIAHLLRVLFRGDLVQEGRELPVPGSFLEEMKSWREQTATAEPAAPVPVERQPTRRVTRVARRSITETTEPRALAAPSGMSRQWVYGLSAGGLLTVGACLWLLLDSPASQPFTGAPPPTPIQPSVAVVEPAPAPTSPPVADEPPDAPATTVSAAPLRNVASEPPPVSEKEAAAVKKMKDAVARAIRKNQSVDAVYHSNHCEELYPDNEDCRLLKRQVNEKFFPERPPPSTARNDADAPELTADNITEIQRRVQELYRSQNIEGALQLANDCALALPKVPECQLMLGVLHARRRDPNKSVHHYEKFLSLAPDSDPRRQRVIQVISHTLIEE